MPDIEKSSGRTPSTASSGALSCSLRELRSQAVGLQRQQVHRRRPDEGRHERGGRLVVNIQRFADLLHHAPVHHDKNVGERHGLQLVMGDIDRSGVEAALQFANFDAHGDAQLGIEVGQRLIEQKHFRLPDNRAAHGDALTLSAGELSRLALEHRA